MNDQTSDDEAPPATPTSAKRVKKPAQVAAAVNDLSSEIERAVERQPSDRVRCVRVFGDAYRCNWWSRSDASATASAQPEWLSSMADRIRKSCFLIAVMRDGHLVIEGVRPDRVAIPDDG